ncbi:MAG: polysaccharide biosynthesis tyrosine autokinase [Alistipes sp.]|nr:polysaccharide biosynthesis tyrosine autokinase [Alistipes sp.]
MTQYREENLDTNTSDTVKISLQDCVRMILSNWYWYLLSAVVFIGAATLYIQSTAPKYLRKATIMVESEEKSIGSDLMALGSFVGGMGGGSSIDTEIQLIKSRNVMEKIVNRYDLSTQYATRDGLTPVDLYGCVPMVATFTEGADTVKGSFKYRVTESGMVRIHGFEDDDKFTAEVAPGDTIVTPLGKLTLAATPFAFDTREVTVTKSTLNSTIEHYREILICDKANKQASVISIALEDDIPARADDIINGVIEEYDINAVSAKREKSQITAEFINERLATLRDELNLIDVEVSDYKRENLIFSPVDEAMISAEEIQQLKENALSLEANLEMTRYVYEYATENSDELRLIPASITLATGASEALSAQIERYNNSLLEYQRLSQSETTTNPILVNLKTQLVAMHEAVISSLESHVATLELQMEQVRREQVKADSRMEGSPTKERELLAIMRQQKVKEQLYIYLLTKIEENTLANATANSNTRVIDAAHGDDKPISPNPLMIYVGALFMALALPFALFYLREMFNTKVRSRSDIEGAITVPCLGEIPMHAGKMSECIVVNEESYDSVSEAFRMLRVNLSFMPQYKDSKVIMVTSSLPDSGKTFVAANLAATLAASGKSVVIVDLNLRRCTLSKQLGHRNDTLGASSYLVGKTSSLNDIITKGVVNGVDMVFAGPLPTNPIDMLMSARMAELIGELRARYDYVIIDSVPALAIADAIIIDTHVDLTLYVVRHDSLECEQLSDIERLNIEKRFHNMGVILNGVRHIKSDYGYGYYNDDESSAGKRRMKKVASLMKK